MTVTASRIAMTLAVLLAASSAIGGEIRDVSALIEPVRAKHNAPGVIAAIARDGEIVGIGTAGVRKLGEPEKAQRGDLLMIGSCGKSATRLLIGRLIDGKRLKLDATLGELLADVKMRDEYKPVTIQQLLTFRGGIQPYTEIGPRLTPQLFELTGTPTEQRAKFVSHLLNELPTAPPGSKSVYSNASYGLLGHIAERLTQTPFEELIAAEVFQPLKMKSARVGMPVGAAALWGHMRGDDGYRPTPGQRGVLHPIAPAGLMSCSIEDFARFAAQLARNEAGSPGSFVSESTARALTDLRPGRPGEEGVPFFGGDGAYTAAFALWPSHNLAIVVGSNAGDNDEVCAAAIEALRAKIAPQARPLAFDAPEAAPVAGKPRLGVMINAIETDAGAEWEIAEVVAGSAAEAAGIKAGDRFVKINGTPVGELSVEERRKRMAAGKVKLTLSRSGKEVTFELDPK